MTELQTLLQLVNEIFWHGFTVFLRMAAIASLLPGFGEQSVPTRVKLAFALALTVVVAPAVPIASSSALSSIGEIGDAALLILAEVSAGLIIGIGIRLFILALQTAGSIAAQATSLSQVLGGAAVDPLPAMGYILIIAGMALAAMSGLHVRAAELLLLSYEFFPLGRFLEASIVSDWGVSQVARAFELAFTLAAPFIILSVLYNFALGAINRAMPQLMVAFVGAPVITLGGLALLMVSAPYMLSVWLDALHGFMSNPFGGSR